MQPRLLHDVKATLGEGPVWDERTETLFWLDILNKRIYADGEVLLELDETVGCLAPREAGGLIFTRRFSFWTVETGPVRTAFLSALADEPANTRFNDGKCDPRGRFLAGTMDLGESEPTGSLYSFDGTSLKRLLGGVTISNGLTWSPDSKTFYYIDTPTRIVRAFDYDVETGAVANPREAVRVPESFGWPDGMTSDAQGNLWIAMWGGAQVTKWDPASGRLLERIPVPAKNVSSCAFGGRNRNELYITSARKGLDEGTLQQYPLTGGVFRLETNVEGMPAFAFAG